MAGLGLPLRLATLLTGLLECLCFAGVLFGWPSLVFVFKKEHYFEKLCEPDAGLIGNATEQADCKVQDERFSLIFTIASFMNNFMTFPSGYIFDRFKTTVARLIAIFFYTTATLIIAFTSAGSAVLLFLAMPLLSIGGILFLITNLQAGGSRHCLWVMGAEKTISGSPYPDAFAVTGGKGTGLEYLWGATRGGFTGCRDGLYKDSSTAGTWHVARTFLLMPRGHIPYPLPPNYSYGLCSGNGTTKEEKETAEQENRELQSKEFLSAKEDQEGITARSVIDQAVRDRSDFNRQRRTQRVIQETPGAGQQQEPRSFWSYAFSRRFAWHLVWLSVIQLWHYLFIGTLNSLLTNMAQGDKELGMWR
ncbi:hypothetical protein P7K49_021786 [Saguinus oedipus]|uniref:Solute carrier family 43 member 3 n=1 Tax=Saguinus oedipus TaxID=9490 RepID=A0ABQ9UTM1_SAGOE|nr:hypothetical protein P7K49_021786 [Saguinus oedipus]